MSSNAYYAELRPDPALRRVVQHSAIALALVGVAVIAGLDVPLALRVSGIAAWTIVLGAQLHALRRGWSDCNALRVYPDGAVAVRGSDGAWSTGRLEPDSVLLRRWGWVRLRKGSGRPFAEPLRGTCRQSRGCAGCRSSGATLEPDSEAASMLIAQGKFGICANASQVAHRARNGVTERR